VTQGAGLGGSSDSTKFENDAREVHRRAARDCEVL
jgi:hypothetical protein